MNDCQRVLAALRGETADRLQRGEVSIDVDFIRALLGFRRRRDLIGEVELRAAIAALDLDLITLDVSTGSYGLAQDVDRKQLRRLGDWRSSGLAVVLRVDGPLNRLVQALGLEAALARLDRGKTRPFGTLDMVTARMRGAVQRAAAAGATAILLVDDAPELKPDRLPLEPLRRFYRPQLAACLHAAASTRLPVILHVAAWHWPLLDDLIKLNPAGLQGLAGRPLAEFREKAGPGICLWGNTGPDWLAEPHTLAEAAAQVQQLVSAGQPRYLFGSANGLNAAAHVETVQALYEAASLEPPRR